MKIFTGIIGLFVLFEGIWLYQKKPLEQSIADGEEIFQNYGDEYWATRCED